MTTKEDIQSTTGHYKKLIEILGKQFIRQKIESPFDFITIASMGVNAHVINNFRVHFEIPRDFTAELLNVSEPTVYRWIKNNKKLERNYSVQLFELTDLFRAQRTVGNSRRDF